MQQIISSRAAFWCQTVNEVVGYLTCRGIGPTYGEIEAPNHSNDAFAHLQRNSGNNHKGQTEEGGSWFRHEFRNFVTCEREAFQQFMEVEVLWVLVAQLASKGCFYA
jgi:hypothetical protein